MYTSKINFIFMFFLGRFWGFVLLCVCQPVSFLYLYLYYFSVSASPIPKNIYHYFMLSSNCKYFTAFASIRNPCVGLVKIDSG